MSVHETYNAPKIVLDYVNDIMYGLRESGFFNDHSIKETYALKKLTELVIEKYVTNPSLDGDDFLWTEDEFEIILQKIIVGSILYQLKDEGILNSYEDDHTDETFFLTEKGKLLKDNLN